MSIVVQKYGGSSVADVEKIGLVADKIVATKMAGHQVVVVVSAMGKTTDQLIALAHQIDPNPPRRELDMMLTTGERVSMALLSMAIQKRGHHAISFTGSQSGIITNDRHFDARIIEIRPHRIEDELARGSIVIIAGFQGMSYRREITTLGRGGSDTTAIALAAALGAEAAEIYSDVDGVYSADPRIVADAKHIPHINYETMQAMADAGAKVLNAAAVEFARRAKITVHARATHKPGRETIVSGSAEDTLAVVDQRGVVPAKSSSQANLTSALDVLAEYGVTPRDLETHAVGWQCLCPSSLTPDWRRASEKLTALGVELGAPEGICTLVGVLDARQAADIARTVADITELPARVHAQARSTSIRVHEDHLREVAETLHQMFAL